VDAEHGPAGDGVTPPRERRVAGHATDGADQALAAALTSREGLAAFVAEVGRVLDVWLVDVWLFDREREVVVYQAVWRRDGVNAAEAQAVGTEVPLDQRPDLALLLERRALVERHIDDADLSAESAALMKRRGYRSSFDVPLFDGGEVVGVLGLVERRAVRRLTEDELALLARVCRLTELGLRAERARRSGDEHAELLQTLVDSSRALAAGLDQNEILAGLQAAVERLLPGIDHDVEVWLHREDDSFERLPLDQDGDDKAAGGSTGRVGAGDGPDTLALRAIARRRPAQARTAGEPTRLVVPLVVAGRAAGYIDVRGRPLRRMTPAELAVVQALGDHVAVALEHRRLSRSLDRQAAIDTVTGFFSRWYFYDRLYSETARAARYNQPLSVVLAGIDGYERFVIGRGRADGEAVLKAIARLVTASLRRKVDVACVHAAGEFALLLPNTAPFKPGATQVAQRLREAVEGMELRSEDNVALGRFTLSVGVAGFPRHAEDADELGGCAVEALAKARALGGGRVQVYGEAPDAHLGNGSGDDVAEPADDDPLSGIILPPDWDEVDDPV